MTASPSSVVLEFDPSLNRLGGTKTLCDGLSAVVQIGCDLWLANDESLSLERLSHQMNSPVERPRFAEHRQFPLCDLLPLPLPPTAETESAGKVNEADIEGLAYQNGYLWLVGSHSLKRKKPRQEHSIAQNSKRLAKSSRDGNRFLLARIPWVEQTQTLARAIEIDGHCRTAARLVGDAEGNALVDALASDEHFAPFLHIPGKDNGFDIEGLAVVEDRVLVGLRGPVLRGWATILELALEPSDSSKLHLRPIGPRGQPYRKHFLQLGGLGVRDLCAWGSDLLILAGPTLALAGPLTVFRWPGGGCRPAGETMTFNTELLIVLHLPAGSDSDQAEGLTLFSLAEGAPPRLLVVYDSTAANRRVGEHAVTVDLFDGVSLADGAVA